MTHPTNGATVVLPAMIGPGTRKLAAELLSIQADHTAELSDLAEGRDVDARALLTYAADVLALALDVGA